MAIKKSDCIKIEGGVAQSVREALTEEAPLQIKINGQAFSVTMRTPGDDAFLVKGLLFSEGVVREEGLNYTYMETANPDHPESTVADISIPEIYVCKSMLEKRSLLSNASCGICGKRELNDIFPGISALHHDQVLDARVIAAMSDAMRREQTHFDTTGGCHAAAGFTLDGRLLGLFEDVGRHNAVDKLLGYLLERGQLDTCRALFVSGRISYEIVAKAHRGGIPFLLAVSAASSMAVGMGNRFGMTIIGFCREDRATIYTHPERVGLL